MLDDEMLKAIFTEFSTSQMKQQVYALESHPTITQDFPLYKLINPVK